jgi:hypothetical protein
MALYLDRIEDAGYIETITGRSHRRAAIVTGVSTSHPAAVCFLATQVAGMPQRGDSHPVHPECTVTSLEAMGIRQADDSIHVLITYESPQGDLIPPGGGGPGFTLEDDTGLIGESTQLLPGNRKIPLVVKFKEEVTDDAGDADTSIRDYQATIDFQRPVRTVTLTGTLKKGVSPSPYREAVGKVNSDPWNGLGVGYWLVAGLASRTSDFGSTYSIQMQLVTRNNEDWSTYCFLRDRNTDQFVRIEDDVAEDLARFDYEYGVIYPEGDNSKGIIRVGPYEMTNFSSIFGG